MKKFAKKKLALHRDIVRVLGGELIQVRGASETGTFTNESACCPDTGPPCSETRSGCGSFADF
jgi:hypothetical protein